MDFRFGRVVDDSFDSAFVVLVDWLFWPHRRFFRFVVFVTGFVVVETVPDFSLASLLIFAVVRSSAAVFLSGDLPGIPEDADDEQQSLSSLLLCTSEASLLKISIAMLHSSSSC